MCLPDSALLRLQVREAVSRQFGQLLFAPREVENSRTAPRRNFGLTLVQPIVDRLDRQAHACGDLCGATERFEDLGDDVVVHDSEDIRTSDNKQAPLNPKCVGAREIPSWQTIRMQEKAFDPDLVRQKMKEMKVSQTAMAKMLGLPSQSAFSNILNGLRRVTADEGAKVYDFLGIKKEPAFRVVPVIGITSAGRWREAVEVPVGHMPIPPRIAGERAFGLEVSGDSMDLLIDDGGWILIDPDRKELSPGSCYLISNPDGEATVKMYQRGPARFEPCSSNDEHKAFLVSETDFTVIGKVVWKGAPVS